MAFEFSRLLVGGYRRLRRVEFPLRSLNVLIGANGVGKSSVLDVFDLLAGSARGNLESAINESGGMLSLLTADGLTSKIALQIQAIQDSNIFLKYGFDLENIGYGYKFSHEVLKHNTQ